MAATNINRVVLTGNLTRDPELRSLPSGMSVCSLRVACNTRRKNNATGDWEDKPNYFDVTVWGEPRLVDRRLLRGAPNVDSPAFAEIGVAADGRVAQVIAVGTVDEQDALRELVARRASVDGNEERLKDPSSALRDIMR